MMAGSDVPRPNKLRNDEALSLDDRVPNKAFMNGKTGLPVQDIRKTNHGAATSKAGRA